LFDAIQRQYRIETNMKIINQALTALLLSVNLFSALQVVDGSAACSPDPLEFSDSIGIKVEKVGSVPTENTDAWTYNMMVADNFDDKIFFLDQQMGRIFCYDPATGGDTMKIFDMTESDIPDGLTLDFPGPGAAQTNRVHMMSQGKTSDEVYVVFSSSTLPTGWTEADAQLPAAGLFDGFFCYGEEAVRDMYRVGTIPACSSSAGGFNSYTIYNVFYKYDLVDGVLSNPEPFFTLENQLLPGHLGGGMVTVDSGKVLWSVGDCLMYGTDGRYAPQMDSEHCGKIILIDPDSPGSYDIVAKGVRNSQQMRVINYSDRNPKSTNAKDLLIFMDIGGVTAEEVNGRFLNQILDTTKIDNFGWGRSMEDGLAREGTCYVGPGSQGVLGTEPPSEAVTTVLEDGYIQPWIQFGRTETDFFYAISSFAVAFKSFKNLHLIWSEFNTGYIMGTTKRFRPGSMYGGPSTGYKLKVYDESGALLENGLNDLVKEELGEVGYYRGDPRLFHYPDGTAGVFIERTGAFYKLTEIDI
jgi:hypothetical protein